MTMLSMHESLEWLYNKDPKVRKSHEFIKLYFLLSDMFYNAYILKITTNNLIRLLFLNI